MEVTRDAQGRLIACSHGQRALLRQEEGGEWTVLADRFEGRRLNSPNDVALHPDGSLWFTDPTYGIDKPEEGYGLRGQTQSEWMRRSEAEYANFRVAFEWLLANAPVISPSPTS